MAKQTIGIGSTANDGTGDTPRVAFDKCNDNFTELYDEKLDKSGGLMTDVLELQSPDPSGAVMSINPPVATGGYSQNLPFWINGYETENSPNLTKNYVVTMGHNLSAGGGRVDASDSAIGLSFEQRYDAGDLDAGGLEIAEMHEFFVTRDSTEGVTAGQQIRLSSYTINKQTNNIDYYRTVHREYLFVPQKDSYADPSDGQYWVVQPSSFNLSRGIDSAVEPTIENSFNVSLSGESGVGSGLLCQLTTSGTFYFVSPVDFASAISVNGGISSQSGQSTWGSGATIVIQNAAQNAVTVSGGIYMSKGCYIAGQAARLEKITPPANGFANEVAIACRDDGTGKMQLVAIMPTGSIKVITTED